MPYSADSRVMRTDGDAVMHVSMTGRIDVIGLHPTLGISNQHRTPILPELILICALRYTKEHGLF